MARKAIYPGTFDPITNGHINIIERGAALFDNVVVAVADSAGKNPLFDTRERVELATVGLANYANVEVVSFSGLLVHFAEQHGANIVIRGVRSIADFEYEAQMVGMNRLMMPTLETVFLSPHSKWADLSSTLVRDIARHDGDIKQFVPSNVEQAISKKLK